MKPSIRAARTACEAIGARQVVLVAFDADRRCAVISYGATRRECAEIRPLCDDIADQLAAATLPGPCATGEISVESDDPGQLRRERDDARAAATVLAHAYEHDTRPPDETLRLAKRWGNR